MPTLSPKYAYLKQAEAAGLATPRTVFLEVYPNAQQLAGLVQSFGDEPLLIVRSANATEDNAASSLAGHFWSSAPIAVSELAQTLQIAWQYNQRILQQLGQTATPKLMVQAYVTHQIGGVLFAPWGFFNDYCQVDYAQHGVKAVVEGEAETVVLSVQDSNADPLPLAESFAFLRAPLQSLASDLRRVFGFALDCEWVYDTQHEQLVIVQVRPQTHLVGAVKPLTQQILQQYPLPAGIWTYTTLSESLGKISPLSFSLLKTLYQESCALFRQFGFAAQHVDFMAHTPDGSVLVDEQRETAFFKVKGLGGFWQGLRAPNIKAASEQFMQHWQAEQAFDYQTLATGFAYWLIAAYMAKGAGRAITPPVHIYELMWWRLLDKPHIPKPPYDWVRLCQVLREVVWFELNKLKQEIKQQPATVAFCSWEEYQQRDVSLAEQRQHQLAPLAIYDYGLLPTKTTTPFQSFSAIKTVTGRVFVINQPSQFQGEIPAACILITPYFDTRWVAQLKHIGAVLVARGGRLSHAALVAREAGVPFCVVSPEWVAAFNSGDRVTLDVARQTLRKV